MHGIRKKKNSSPENTSNVFSQLFFCWVMRLLKLGKKKKLIFDDLYTCNDEDLSKPLGDNLEVLWGREIAKAAKHKRKPSLLRAIIKGYITSYMGYGLLLLIQCLIIKMVQPLVMYRLLTYFMDPDNIDDDFGIIRTVVFLIIALLYIFMYQHTMLGCHRVGTRVKTACSSLIYRKLLKLSLHTIETSKVKIELNFLLTKEINKLEKAAMFLHFLWITPIQTCVVLYFMYCLGGYFSTIGCGTVFLFVVFSNAPLISYNEKYENEIKTLSSKQRSQMKTIVKNIMTVKMLACEDMIDDLIRDTRQKQSEVNHKRSLTFGLTSGIVYYSARLGIFATVMSYFFSNSLFTTQLMYTIIQFLNLVEIQMAVLLPMSIKCYWELRVVVRGIKRFLLLPEMEIQTKVSEGEPGLIKLKNLTASWSPKGKQHNLVDVNLNLKPGKVYAVTGPRQSGKSTLILSILNEVPIISGDVEVSGRISYASQEPWIFESSIKHNIIMDNRFQKNKYAFVLKVCGINVDLDASRYGDQSIVNEHIFLDDSQQARLNMARAAYSSADIYIFDESLESMKVSIAQKLYKGCIMRYLRPNKTVIITTSQIDILKMVDYVIVVKDSKVTMSLYSDIPKEELSKYRWLRTALDTNRMTNIEMQTNNRKFMSGSPEMVEKRKVNLRTLIKFTKYYSNRTLRIWFVFLLILTQVVVNGGDFVLMLWSSLSEECLQDASNGNYTEEIFIFDYPMSRVSRKVDQSLGKACYNSSATGVLFYFAIYALLAISTFGFVCYSIFLYRKIRSKVRKDFHDTIFGNILRAEMQFYYENSISSVVQTLANDINIVEGLLPDKLWDVLIIMSICIGMVITMCVFVPVAIPVVFLIGFFLYKMHGLFTATTNEIAKIVSDTSGILFKHILDTISGLVTIRSNQTQKMNTKEFHDLYDDRSSATSIITVIWKMYSLYIDIFFTIFLAFMIFQFFFMPNFIPYIIASVVGLVITDCYYFIGFVQYGLKQMNKISLDLYSVDNIIKLKTIPQEKRVLKGDKKYPDNWPNSGSIKITDLSISTDYFADKLYNFNLTIENGKKVAILGEPGSGQYCLIYALFRMCEYQGTIEIDNVDTSKVDLLDLRRNISILAPEPIIFTTTLRNNVNYHGASTDTRLEEILKMVGMSSRLDLESEIDNKEFSVEDKHMINLMRILAKQNKIVILEDSAIKLEKEVENEIHNIIKKEFSKSTIIYITNKFPKILSYDYCVFLEKGEIVKEGVPKQLIESNDPYIQNYLDFLSPEELAEFNQFAAVFKKDKIKATTSKNQKPPEDDEID